MLHDDPSASRTREKPDRPNSSPRRCKARKFTITVKRADTSEITKWEDTLSPAERRRLILDRLAIIAKRLMSANSEDLERKRGDKEDVLPLVQLDQDEPAKTA